MLSLESKGELYTIAELSEISGIDAATLRDRLRRGYTVEEAVQMIATTESVKEFCEASWYRDWLGISTSSLYDIYWRWCISNGYNPINQKVFTRQILAMYPHLKIVPTRLENGYCRIIRER
jgi:hypothetical protein